MEWRPYRQGRLGRAAIPTKPAQCDGQDELPVPCGTSGTVHGKGYPWQPHRRSETRTVSPGAVGSLVRRLIATERARLLGRRAIDLGRYTLEKRAQRWRESRKGFKHSW